MTSKIVGISLMIVLAKSFLQHNKQKAFTALLDIDPSVVAKYFYKYVDGIHVIFDTDDNDADKFQHALNQRHSSIQ